jgi:hypothetical protein
MNYEHAGLLKKYTSFNAKLLELNHFNLYEFKSGDRLMHRPLPCYVC